MVPVPGLTWNTGYIVPFGFGISTGILSTFLASAETRWVVYALGGMVGLLIILATPAKRFLLMTIFILSLQIDVHLRFLYGYSDTGGFAIPLVVVAGFVFFVWYAGAGQLSGFNWAGSMGMPIAALFITTLFSMLTTMERYVGLTELWYRLEYNFLYWLVFNSVHTKEDFSQIVKILLIILGIQSIVYLIQSTLGLNFDLAGYATDLGEAPRPGGTVGTNPAGFASFIMPALLIAIANFIAQDHFMSKRFLFVALTLGTVAIGLTYTRAPWIGFAMAVAFVVIYGFRQRLIKINMVVWVIAIAGIGAALLLPTMFIRIQSEYGTISTDATLDERSGLLKIALNIITSHPITGVGPGAYGFVYHDYIPGGLDQWFFIVHNEFLLRAAETGIPGALAFVALLIVGIRVALRLARAEPSLISISALGWLGALFALIWQMNWVPWIGWSYNAMLWVMLGLMDGAQRLVAQDAGAQAIEDAKDSYPRAPTSRYRNADVY